LGVLVAEFEDMADLDGRVDAQGRAAARASFSGGHGAQGGVGSWMKVNIGRDVLEVVILFIGSADEIFPALERFIDDEDRLVRVVETLGRIEIDRTEEAGGRAKQSLNFFFGHGMR